MGSERAYQFFRLVEWTRDKQKEFFRTRDAAVLNESKHLERDVDKEIQRVVQNHPSIWAEKGAWNWVLANPVMFPEPITGVKGKLSFWN